MAKFVEKWGTTLLGGMTGIIVSLLLISPLVKNNYVEVLLLVVLALLGGYTGFKLNREVKVYSTSIIGAGFLMIGVNSFLGGLPDFFNL
jgi:uncharacterized membrane protein YccC